MTLQGTIIHIGDIEVISEKFSKRIVVVKTDDDEYPQEIPLQVTNKNLDKVSVLKVGQTVTAHINLRGRAYTDKNGKAAWFSSIDAWKFDTSDTTAPTAAPTTTQDEVVPF